MEARPSVGGVCLCCLLAFAGCSIPNSPPATRPEESEPGPIDEHSEVVEASESADVEAAGDVEQVQRWIERIQRRDDLRSRIEPRTLEETLTSTAQSSYESEQQQPGTLPEPSPEPLAADPQQKVPFTPPAPVLGSVSVRAAPSLSEDAPEADAPASVNAPVQAPDESPILAQLAEQLGAPTADPSFRNQLDQRLLQVLAGKYEDARRPLELVSNEQHLMATRLIEALIAIREGHGGQPEAEADRVLAQIEQLADSLVPLCDLRIPTLALTRAVRGFGRYEAFDPPDFAAGRENEFVAYCEVANFVSRLRDDGRYQSQFSMRTAVLNRAGDVVLEINDEHLVDECHTRRHDCFIPRLVRLPSELPPGEYVLKVTITDKIGKKVAEKRTTFRIVARS
jgi:hypothetical protein